MTGNAERNLTTPCFESLRRFLLMVLNSIRKRWLRG
jgi:hypothetical protein